MSNYVQVKCSSCKSSFITSTYRGEIDEEHKTCETCDTPTEIIAFENIIDPEVIIDITDAKMEDSNHHSMSDVPRNIWSNIEKYIPDDKKADVARAIYRAFH